MGKTEPKEATISFCLGNRGSPTENQERNLDPAKNFGIFFFSPNGRPCGPGESGVLVIGPGFFWGGQQAGMSGERNSESRETVPAAGGGLLEGAPEENGIENTNPGGPIGPVVIQPNINPAGSGASVPVTKPTLTPQQQFSPEYQAWRNNPNNAKTVAMIDSLSPDGQKIANTYYNSMALGDGIDPLQVLLSDGILKQSDWTIVNNFRNSAFASEME